MSLPRAVIPGSCSLITRRCSERRFFLKPSPSTNACFWYVLAWAANRHNIGVVAACAMSNHYHLVVVDHDGKLPNFLRDFNSFLARCMNAHLGHWEGFWDRAQTSVVTLTDAASQLDKTNYVLTNPVKDHLVGTVAAWPGANSLNDTRKDSQGRRSITINRPEKFFRSDERAPSRLPDSVTLTLISPPEWEADEFHKAIVEQVAETEKDIQSARVRDKNVSWGVSPSINSVGINHPRPMPSAVSSHLALLVKISGVVSRPSCATRHFFRPIARHTTSIDGAKKPSFQPGPGNWPKRVQPSFNRADRVLCIQAFAPETAGRVP